MGVSLSIMAWSALGLTTRHGPLVLLGLFILLTLVGGGIGHIPFFALVWAWSTRIRSALPWWRRRLGGRARAALSRTWLPGLALSSLLFLAALELSVFGYPPLADDPELLLLAIWSILLGFARAAERGLRGRDRSRPRAGVRPPLPPARPA